jgi:hypothetical protein
MAWKDKEKQRAYAAKYHAEHREAIAARNKAHYTAHREQHQARNAAYRKANPEKCRARWTAHNATSQHRASGEKYRATHQEECRARSENYSAAHPEKVRAAWRRSGLKRKYGITPAQFETILAAQGGCCAICGTFKPGGRGMFHVDHNHRTGKLRGVLCHKCNTAIGLLGDSPCAARAAADYLERNL